MFESEVSEAAPRSRAHSADELPETLYRLKTMHSSETSFGYYVAAGTEWPHFRTERELEALLEGPFATGSDGFKSSAVSSGIDGEADADPERKLPDEIESGNAISEVMLIVEPEIAPEAVPEPSPETALDAMPDSAPDSAVSAAETKALRPQRIPARALVIAPTKYGKDVVEVQGQAMDTSFVNPDELVLIERPAGIDDLRKLKENKEKEKHAYELCRDKIWARNLPMKLVSAHYLLDEPKILFYFTAESRVDFRELVKDLVSLFKMRIELRQIGVRDEARVTGGCGVCGRVLCCHGISDRLNPVSIKMAKDQNLSLNSLKISGPCGRLLCCLSYEFQFYKDARRELPQEGVKFIYDGTLFKVVEVNALSSTVKMAGEDGRVLDMKAERFKYSEGRWKVIEEQAE
ncbi:MAG TPA: regulatory iron-sulfur-containing complex subunit RicT [Rectinemataceae bacterium]|nr:regulatory iron-sulfur-containing complex subunit RicT [Rectinemataceae bacterium]